ncbi:MAG: hypothetical protein IH986_04455 [Planctomycetes bacterium]|nr:hypothetical protein [Planctomycetota bacterium]
MYKLIGLVLVVATSTSALAQVEYWAAVRNIAGPNELHLFDGPNLIRVIEQYPGAASDPWGFRDGAASTRAEFFFGWADGVVRYSDNGNSAELVINGPPPEIGVWRALAFDPRGTGQRASFWSANFGSALIKVDLQGNLLTRFPNPGVSILALAFDDDDGNLWALTTNGDIVKLDTRDGSIIPGRGWPPRFPNTAWSGLGGLHDLTERVATLGDTKLVVYGDPPLGPWELPGETYMGLAAVVDPCARFVCGDANRDGRFDGGDIDAFFFFLGCLPYPCCKINCDELLCIADINRDGAVNGGDIDPFFEALGRGGCR